MYRKSEKVLAGVKKWECWLSSIFLSFFVLFIYISIHLNTRAKKDKNGPNVKILNHLSNRSEEQLYLIPSCLPLHSAAFGQKPQEKYEVNNPTEHPLCTFSCLFSCIDLCRSSSDPPTWHKIPSTTRLTAAGMWMRQSRRLGRAALGGLSTFSMRSRHSALSIQSMASHWIPSLWGHTHKQKT